MSRSLSNREFAEKIVTVTNQLPADWYLYGEPVIPEDGEMPEADLTGAVLTVQTLSEP